MLQHVGVYLPTPVFAHGQLDVAVMRVGDPEGRTVMIPHDSLGRFPHAPGRDTWLIPAIAALST